LKSLDVVAELQAQGARRPARQYRPAAHIRGILQYRESVAPDDRGAQKNHAANPLKSPGTGFHLSRSASASFWIKKVLADDVLCTDCGHRLAFLFRILINY